MAEILLLEPNYLNKYPPLGLMKIAYYHSEMLKDYVYFAKGKVPDCFQNKKWDRVYVTSLFTFEFENTIKAIEYAKKIVKDPGNVFVGGIAATLMPDVFYKRTGIEPKTGLLDDSSKLGYEAGVNIDELTPNYNILKDVKDNYIYPFNDAYFMYTTRGCGMKCGFCAVQELEPNYIPYVSIKDRIKEIDEKYGQQKDLLLMDNNVLRSPHFNKIVDEIKAVGFAKDAFFRNSKTGLMNKRYVDFNQGLDAFLLTEDKARKLSELALRPARIAFDHIEDQDVYEKAIKRCVNNGIKHLSNYILYNSEAFTGKGHSYMADTPKDLYDRLRFTVDLQESLGKESVSIFSFPMRYIPLDTTKRGFVASTWSLKYLRAIQRILIPTQGKGVSSLSFFEAAFGKDADEYMEILAMPEEVIGVRGRFDEVKKGIKNETNTEREKRRAIWIENHKILNEWKRLFNSLGTHKKEFVEIIEDNSFSLDRLMGIKSDIMRKLYLYYFTPSQFLKLISDVEDQKLMEFIVDYTTKEFEIFLRRYERYIYNTNVPFSRLKGFVKIYKELGLKLLLEHWVSDDYSNDIALTNYQKAQNSLNLEIFDIRLLRLLKRFLDLRCINEDQLENIEKNVLQLNKEAIVALLKDNIDSFKLALNGRIENEAGKLSLVKYIDEIINGAHEQLELFNN